MPESFDPVCGACILVNWTKSMQYNGVAGELRGKLKVSEGKS